MNGKSIAYASSPLKNLKKNYPIRDLEFGSVVFAIKILCCYLYGVHGCSHNPLESPICQNDLNIQKRKWIELLIYYNMSILYNIGKDNFIVDSLSKLSIWNDSHVKEGRNTWLRKFIDVHIWVSVS